MSWLIKLLGIKPNDWYPVWRERALWNITRKRWCDFTGRFLGEYMDEEYAFFEIIFSPSRNVYKLKYSGYDPEAHRYSKIAVQKLNEFINGQVKVK